MVVAGVWNGNLFGTNTGRLHLRLEQKAELISGDAWISDDRLGTASFDVWLAALPTYSGSNFNRELSNLGLAWVLSVPKGCCREMGVSPGHGPPT